MSTHLEKCREIERELLNAQRTAKRLFGALLQTLQRHEQTFGQIELDVRRRAQPQGPLGGAAGS